MGTGLPYVGGKARLAGWVAERLPLDCSAYIEPYAGMLSVLLARSSAPLEVVNDADKRIVTWWRMVRDRADELADMLDCTPYSRDEYLAAWDALHSDCEQEQKQDDLRVAWAVSVLLAQGYVPSLAGGRGDWLRVRPTGIGYPSQWERLPDKVRHLAGRMRSVVLENRDALEVLEQWLDDPQAVIYCDPPYLREQARDLYGMPDQQPALGLLGLLQDRQVRARVAVSGGEWCPYDTLGWHREETTLGRTTMRAGEHCPTRRTEVLWTNYESGGQERLW